MRSRFLAVFIFSITFLASACRDKTYSQGERLYKAHCANCHMEDGTGLARLIPPLAKADFLKRNQERIPCIIRNGQEGKITVNGVEYDQVMPGEKYTEIQINNMINYINTAWGNDLPAVSILQTKERLKQCTEDN